MKIHKEGYPTIILVLVLVVLISVVVSYVSSIPLITYGVYAVLIAFFVFIVRFFRVPNRVYTTNPHAIIAPADGKIVAIEEIYEPTFLN